MKSINWKEIKFLLGTVAMALTLTACSSPEKTLLEDKPNIKVIAEYYSVRNDINQSLSSPLSRSMELDQNLTTKGSYHQISLGHAVAVICIKPTDCGQSSNLANLIYTVTKENKNLVIHGRMVNTTGASTLSEGGVGWVRWSISKDAKLHSEGTTEQMFTLPIIKGTSITLIGPLYDKLVLTVE
ncbi:hypothetical protein [Vibrio anguillarum]|uniref:hypothetical protein n=2 Tax=Vibrio anguillarum TaxID=55601 RepID=UPI000BB50F53|nr:hypothetical protein [Vibrio anguillarum]ATC60111.1 hypothetical protein CMV05_22160 [Vibrio anguillarum]MBF4252781.1 hypothetical protein [Vibrio anguillarum]MBF4307664.1 hypothetical protein [Vibrio anguillarum]MBF4341605.1 hypothetical protein [Vibrio anguillarum]